MSDEDKVLTRVLDEATSFLSGLDDRPVAARADVDQVAEALGGPLPEDGSEALEVVEALIAGAEPGVVAMPSGRFFGWVIGGVLPAALAADWLTSTWDQNAGLLVSSPAAAGAERVAAGWLLDLLGLPPTAAVGYVTGGMMANFTCLAAARHEVLPPGRLGRRGAGSRRRAAGHGDRRCGASRDRRPRAALSRTGAGARAPWCPPTTKGGCGWTRWRRAARRRSPRPADRLPAGGQRAQRSVRPAGEAIDLAHRHGAWVHVDGAFGLWAAASPSRTGAWSPELERADSWATDAHKTLNVPYDNGLAIVADSAALYAAMGVHAAYLIQDERPDPFATVPEFSRRARGFTVWAALRSLGRSGVAEMVERFCARARQFADGLSAIDGVEVVNDVVFTQVCVSFGPDEVTREVARRLLADGTAWMTPSTWHGRAVLRISVSNWRTGADGRGPHPGGGTPGAGRGPGVIGQPRAGRRGRPG